MDLIRKIPKKFNKKFGIRVINRQYFCRRTGLKGMDQLKTSLKVHTVCTVHAPIWLFSAVGFNDKPGHEFDSSHWLKLQHSDWRKYFNQ